MRVDNWAGGAKTARVGANSARGGRGGVVVPVVPTKDLVPLTFSLGGVAGTPTSIPRYSQRGNAGGHPSWRTEAAPCAPPPAVGPSPLPRFDFSFHTG